MTKDGNGIWKTIAVGLGAVLATFLTLWLTLVQDAVTEDDLGRVEKKIEKHEDTPMHPEAMAQMRAVQTSIENLDTRVEKVEKAVEAVPARVVEAIKASQP